MESGWIDANERLPEPETDVLVAIIGSYGVYYAVAGIFNGEWKSAETESTLRGNVGAWHLLPE